MAISGRVPSGSLPVPDRTVANGAALARIGAAYGWRGVGSGMAAF